MDGEEIREVSSQAGPGNPGPAIPQWSLNERSPSRPGRDGRQLICGPPSLHRGEGPAPCALGMMASLERAWGGSFNVRPATQTNPSTGWIPLLMLGTSRGVFALWMLLGFGNPGCPPTRRCGAPSCIGEGVDRSGCTGLVWCCIACGNARAGREGIVNVRPQSPLNPEESMSTAWHLVRFFVPDSIWLVWF